MRNFASAAPAINAAVTAEPTLKRRQDLKLFTLMEDMPIQTEETCKNAFVGVLPERVDPVPNLDTCIRCGGKGWFRRLPVSLGGETHYLSPHGGVRALSSLATTQVVALTNDPQVGFDVAADLGSEPAGGEDRGIVYDRATHELKGTLFRNSSDQLAFRTVAAPADHLKAGFGHALAVSSRRNEVAFFDALSYLNADLEAVRHVGLSNGIERRMTLRFPAGVGEGTTLSAAYRAADDAYFFLRRSTTASKMRLFRLGPAGELQTVLEFTDSGAGAADLSADEDGRLAITRRGGGFATVVLVVNADLTVTPLAHLSSTDNLGASPILTAEGIVLERGGESRDKVIPLVQSGEPNLDLHDLGGGLWQSIFQ